MDSVGRSDVTSRGTKQHEIKETSTAHSLTQCALALETLKRLVSRHSLQWDSPDHLGLCLSLLEEVADRVAGLRLEQQLYMPPQDSQDLNEKRAIEEEKQSRLETEQKRTDLQNAKLDQGIKLDGARLQHELAQIKLAERQLQLMGTTKVANEQRVPMFVRAYDNRTPGLKHGEMWIPNEEIAEGMEGFGGLGMTFMGNFSNSGAQTQSFTSQAADVVGKAINNFINDKQKRKKNLSPMSKRGLR